MRSRVGRWVAVGGLVLVAFLYVRPIHTYLDTRSRLDGRAAELDELRAQKRALDRRLAASTSGSALALEARRLGYVKPGEHLFIVKGIHAWRKAHRAR